jgi:hypothetical protein
MLCQRPYLLQKQHKNYILYSLLLLYLLIIIKQRYGKAEQQSFRAAEVCTKPPFWTRPLCTTTPCPLQDEAPLHSCSMPPFGRGPSALLLHASIWTRPFCTTAPCPLQDEAPSARTFSAPDQALCRTDNSTCWKTLQTDNYHLSAYETQLQHPARTLTPSKFCYYLI